MAIPAAPVAREWVTPQEQVKRLICPFVEKQLHREGNRQRLESIPQSLLDPIIESIARASMKSLILTDLDSGAKERVPLLFDLGVQDLLFQLDPLPSILTDWYTALERTVALPEMVPALPQYMPQILDDKCPIWGDEQKPDGTHYKYLDGWSLCLKTSETLNELEMRVRDYGARLYPNRNPLQFKDFLVVARQTYGDVRFNQEPYWILHTNTVLPESWKKSYQEQVQMVEDLSFEVPSLSETATVCFNRQITKGETLYPRNPRTRTYTKVVETVYGHQLAVGGSDDFGVRVDHNGDRPHDWFGIAAVKRF